MERVLGIALLFRQQGKAQNELLQLDILIAPSTLYLLWFCARFKF